VEDGISNAGYIHNDFYDNTIHQTVEYEYDYNGNLVSDDNKGIQSISYNYLNLPEEIVFSSSQKINYLYAADGKKLRETITNGQTVHTYDYCGNTVYFDQELSYILTPAGRAVYDQQQRSWSNEYFLKDHLGNVRVVYGDPDRRET
jgi:YD repeat-containing protein